MKGTTCAGCGWGFVAIVVILEGWLSAFPLPANAQIGQNAVYNSSGTCSPSCAASTAFIDASVFISGTNPNICAVLHNLLNGNLLLAQGGYPAGGSVIDARGISGATALTCTSSPRVAHPSRSLA